MVREKIDMKKKYIVFQFDKCYQCGGLGDVTGDFDTLEEAKEFCKKDRYAYNEVVDRDTWEEVWSLD